MYEKEEIPMMVIIRNIGAVFKQIMLEKDCCLVGFEGRKKGRACYVLSTYELSVSM